jgi:hypothetical protein
MTWTTLAAPDTAAASSYTTVMDHIAQAFEVLGTLILAIGVLWSFALAVLAWRRSRLGQRAYKALRQRSAARCCSPWRSWSPPTWSGPSPLPHAQQRPGPRADRADQDIPQLLPGDRN